MFEKSIRFSFCSFSREVDMNSYEMEIKIFQNLQKDLAAVGIISNKQRNIHWRSTFCQVVIGFVEVIKLGVYIFCEASTADEYIDSIFPFIVLFGITICSMNTISSNDQIFATIEFCAKQMSHREQSKS